MFKIEINNRSLIPVRLIPFITGWQFSPDAIVRILAGRDGFHRVHIQSFHLITDGTHKPMQAKESMPLS